MRVLVCGGRKYADRSTVHRELYALCPEAVGTVPNDTWLAPRDMVVIHGGAEGADRHADEWAVVNGLMPLEFKAHWDDLAEVPCRIAYRRGDGSRPYNALAGINRNARMLAEGRPDLVLAFPGGRGTGDMVERALAAGVEVKRIA